MEQKETIEGNSLIELFVNTKHTIKNGWVQKNDEVDTQFTIGNLKYHDSWDALMPVCNKLGIEYISTDIKKAYNEVLERIKQLDRHS